MFKNIVDQMSSLRDAVGDELDLILDLNSNFKADGVIRIANALRDLNIRWLEIDVLDADVLRDIREKSPIPIGGCEMICSAQSYAPFFVKRSLDVPLIDVCWNGFLESVKIANVANVFDLNISPQLYRVFIDTN